MKRLNVVFFFGITGLLFFSSCKHDDISLEAYPAICFEDQILPLLQDNCAGCHTGGENGGYDYTSYSGIIKDVSPGKPFDSKLYTILTTKWGHIMPPDNPLSKENRTLIRLWIEQGAKNTTCGSTVINPFPNDSICFKTEILPILNSSCALSNCHDPYSAQEDIILSSYWNVMNSDDDDLVIPGDPYESELYEVITETDPDKRMPPIGYSALNQDQINKIFDWISEGALDRDCETAGCDTSNIGFASVIWPILENNCKGCHIGAAPNGGISIENYNDVKLIADNNHLINALYGSNGVQQMPPTNPLSDCNIQQIEIWIAEGSLNN